MAKYTRGAVKIDWLRNPSVEIAMAAAMNVAPRWPNARRITAVAGVVVAASACGPSERRHTQFTPM